MFYHSLETELVLLIPPAEIKWRLLINQRHPSFNIWPLKQDRLSFEKIKGAPISLLLISLIPHTDGNDFAMSSVTTEYMRTVAYNRPLPITQFLNADSTSENPSAWKLGRGTKTLNLIMKESACVLHFVFLLLSRPSSKQAVHVNRSLDAGWRPVPKHPPSHPLPAENHSTGAEQHGLQPVPLGLGCC